MEARYFSTKIVEWYNLHKRSLPWRSTQDPYTVWLSEIILQQTRVSQGLPYYEKFVTEFPDVHALAAAPLQKVLRLWQGLGYYTRARNLHACAKEVVKKFTGKFPETYEELKRLPGIGEYTAAAIASICYNEPVAVVDGNVFRVLARIFGEETPINTPIGKKYFTTLANTLISNDCPATHNQAVMEFGALHCIPKNPGCMDCVFASGCEAFKSNLQSILPVKIQNRKNRRRYFYYFVIKKGNALLMNQRKGKDIWRGLYDFYLVEAKRSVKPERLVQKDSRLKKMIAGATQTTSGVYRHILSHQTIISRFVLLELAEKPALLPKSMRFYSGKKVHDLPKPVLISHFLHDFRIL
jgi:A/G-specific adenine glycosylase